QPVLPGGAHPLGPDVEAQGQLQAVVQPNPLVPDQVVHGTARLPALVGAKSLHACSPPNSTIGRLGLAQYRPKGGGGSLSSLLDTPPGSMGDGRPCFVA